MISSPDGSGAEADFATVPYSKPLFARLMATIRALQAHPALSFPDALGSAGYKAFARMLANPRVQEAPPLEALSTATRHRLEGVAQALALHDTTEYRFGGKKLRTGLQRLNKNDQGFLAHTCLAVAADGSRRPLGLLSLEPLVRRPDSIAHQTDRQRYDDPTKEFLRWGRGVRQAHLVAPSTTSLLHILDREGDDYALMAQMLLAEPVAHRFLLRSRLNRLLFEPPSDGPEARKVRDTFAHLPLQGQREVPLQPRQGSARPAQRKLYPTREQRLAKLEVRARRVRVRRPHNAPLDLPAFLELNLVQVEERDPPEGEPPISWWLWTNEPIDTPEQLWGLVDSYRARWVIEEFFKATKTGCSYEKRQQESFESLWIVLLLLVPIALRLLWLRSAAHDTPEAPASLVVTEEEREVLDATLPPRRVPRDLNTAVGVLLAIAELGGHLRHNGRPGWLILLRGWAKLQQRLVAWRAAKQSLA